MTRAGASGRRRLALPLACWALPPVALGAASVGYTLARVGAHSELILLGRLGGWLVLAGLLAQVAAACLPPWPRRPGPRPPTRSAPAAGEAGGGHRGRVPLPVRACNAALLLLAVALPLGEGVAWVALALLAGALLWARGAAAVAHRPLAPAAQGCLLRLTTYWVLGLLAAVASAWASPFGLRPAALGRVLAPAPLLLLAAPALQPAARHRAAALYLLTMGAVSCLGLLLAALGLGPEQLGLAGAANGQSLRPHSTLPVAAGLYFHRLKMAHALLVPLSWLLVRNLLGDPAGPRHQGRPWVLLLALEGLSLWACAARAAWAAVALAVLWLGWPGRRLRALRPNAALLGLCGVALAVGGGLLAGVPALTPGRGAVTWAQRPAASQMAPILVDERALLWRAALQTWRRHPFGVGLGNYGQAVAQTYAEMAREAPAPLEAALAAIPRTGPHALWLAPALEGGPVAFCCFWAFWAELARTAAARVRPSWRRPATRQEQLALTALTLLGLLFVVGLTHDVLFHQVVALSVYAALGLCLAECAGPPTGHAA